MWRCTRPLASSGVELLSFQMKLANLSQWTRKRSFILRWSTRRLFTAATWHLTQAVLKLNNIPVALFDNLRISKCLVFFLFFLLFFFFFFFFCFVFFCFLFLFLFCFVLFVFLFFFFFFFFFLYVFFFCFLLFFFCFVFFVFFFFFFFCFLFFVCLLLFFVVVVFVFLLLFFLFVFLFVCFFFFWFCWVLIFASVKALSAIYLLPVMIHGWVRRPPHGPNKYMFLPLWELRARVGIL